LAAKDTKRKREETLPSAGRRKEEREKRGEEREGGERERERGFP
jgi:hypothetical protein